jgi:hypothetical protein
MADEDDDYHKGEDILGEDDKDVDIDNVLDNALLDVCKFNKVYFIFHFSHAL